MRRSLWLRTALGLAGAVVASCRPADRARVGGLSDPALRVDTIVADGETTVRLVTATYQLVTNAPHAVDAYRRALDEASRQFGALFADAPPRIVIGVIDTTNRREAWLPIADPAARRVVIVLDGRRPASWRVWDRRRSRPSPSSVARDAAGVWVAFYATERAARNDIVPPTWLITAVASWVADRAAGDRAAALLRTHRTSAWSLCDLLSRSERHGDSATLALHRTMLVAFLIEHLGPSSVRRLVGQSVRAPDTAAGSGLSVFGSDAATLDSAWREWRSRRGLAVAPSCSATPPGPAPTDEEPRR